MSAETAGQRVGLPGDDIKAFIVRSAEEQAREREADLATALATAEEVELLAERQRARNAQQREQRQAEVSRRETRQREFGEWEAGQAEKAGLSLLEYRQKQADQIVEQERVAEEKVQATRESLLATAAVARQLGLSVRSSKGRDGKVSSYYIEGPTGRKLRVSDHAIPSNVKRDSEDRYRGGIGYAGYPGEGIILTPAYKLRCN